MFSDVKRRVTRPHEALALLQLKCGRLDGMKSTVIRTQTTTVCTRELINITIIIIIITVIIYIFLYSFRNASNTINSDYKRTRCVQSEYDTRFQVSNVKVTLWCWRLFDILSYYSFIVRTSITLSFDAIHPPFPSHNKILHITKLLPQCSLMVKLCKGHSLGLDPTQYNLGHFGSRLHSQSLDWYWQNSTRKYTN